MTDRPALLLDLDGTLVDSVYQHAIAWHKAHELGEKDAAKLKKAHARLFATQLRDVRPLPGAQDLVRHLTKMGVSWAVATSGALASAQPLLKLVNLPAGVPVITRDDVAHAKPNPDLWIAAALRLGVS